MIAGDTVLDSSSTCGSDSPGSTTPAILNDTVVDRFPLKMAEVETGVKTKVAPEASQPTTASAAAASHSPPLGPSPREGFAQGTIRAEAACVSRERAAEREARDAQLAGKVRGGDHSRSPYQEKPTEGAGAQVLPRIPRLPGGGQADSEAAVGLLMTYITFARTLTRALDKNAKLPEALAGVVHEDFSCELGVPQELVDLLLVVPQ